MSPAKKASQKAAKTAKVRKATKNTAKTSTAQGTAYPAALETKAERERPPQFPPT